MEGPSIERFVPSSALSSPRPPNQFQFVAVVALSFAAAFCGVLAFIRAAVSIYRLWKGPPEAGASEISPEQKKEIDELRAAALRRYLNEFTVTLNGNDVSAHLQSAQSCIQTNETPINEGEEQKIDVDEELAIDESDEFRKDKCRCPSVSLLARGTDDSFATTDTDARASGTSTQTYQKIPQMFHENDEMMECTICREEFKPLERICRSSNSNCKHFFHEECIVHWLVSSGWLKQPRVLPENLKKNEKSLLSYDLECPICRQVFIDGTSSSMDGDQVGGEEIA